MMTTELANKEVSDHKRRPPGGGRICRKILPWREAAGCTRAYTRYNAAVSWCG